jgi:hypothetical protein
MKKTSSLFLCSVLMALVAYAQPASVFVDFQKQLFDDGKPLPVDENFIIRGNVQEKISFMNVSLLKKAYKQDKPLHIARWVRSDDHVGNTFVVPINFRLHSGGAYTFVFEKYRKITEYERFELTDMLKVSIQTYILSSIEKINDRYYFKDSPMAPYLVMNDILEKGLANFENKLHERPAGFSAIVENLLLMITQTNLKKKQVVDEEVYSEGPLLELVKQAFNEIDMITNAYDYVLDERLIIKDYPVEHDPYLVAVNVGYAGAYYQGMKEDAEFLSGLYAGITFALGKRGFWSDASFSTGVFIKNFQLEGDSVLSGPLVKRPIYAAFGYGFLNFLRVHAGAVIMNEKENKDTNKGRVLVRPMLGISAELNILMGRKKR